MPDAVDPGRSRQMSLIKAKDTKPEMIVRRLAHSLGYRFRLHRKDLPGKPDLVFPGRKAVILVHGCFWHRHRDAACKLARLPKSRLGFWYPKLEQNAARDKRNEAELKHMGWRVLTIWECQVKDLDALGNRIRGFLGTRS